ncbi:MAG: two-component system response regulator [Sphingobacteriales bacterium 17-39-43]|uniref:response regulator n=1 Tax=Daejeonella sp. TaxID=2805397 RepID=UPI000BDDD881|nr:response regulator [Daejeonella sp.]OYZ30982.1 MAG: two-component system response regulator [Sphingobacteriales bacterium 16-39-50]OZA23791.1 MAG: two-component system response regulator [Sphingobacteriales bacterium 17-39-43]HQS52992.1 response regulator [Daejeonella sp.]HQT22764.1 response regulator [Daejeonella sp.]HQT57761.1 response regulator [Daejeonella sp.]
MKPIHILLVEDNQGDILLILDAFEEGKITNQTTVIKDGKSAIDFLADNLNSGKLPDLVMLDVNLPKKNGHEVLSYIKTSEHLKSLPVIMLTTSSSPRDIKLSYQNHANCYITKPVGAADFMDAINKIEDFWINIVQLPKH